MKKLLILAFFTLSVNMIFGQKNIIKEGHRGTRGLMPENTIAAMKKSLDLGTQVLELDVVISKDNQVVVSHDAYISADFSLKLSGDSITAAEQKTLILYSMPYAEIRKYDVGSKHNVQFPRQLNFRASKPLLSELIDSVDLYAKEKKLPLPMFNIEIKSNPKTDGIEQPATPEFVELVMKVCKPRNMKRMNIQSFDVRPLQLIHKQFPDVRLAFLTANAKTVEENLSDLGFTPDIYSPYYKSVTKEVIVLCHQQKMQIIPWTVNTKEEIDVLVALNVDGIITDYPDLF